MISKKPRNFLLFHYRIVCFPEFNYHLNKPPNFYIFVCVKPYVCCCSDNQTIWCILKRSMKFFKGSYSQIVWNSDFKTVFLHDIKILNKWEIFTQSNIFAWMKSFQNRVSVWLHPETRHFFEQIKMSILPAFFT